MKKYIMYGLLSGVLSWAVWRFLPVTVNNFSEVYLENSLLGPFNLVSLLPGLIFGIIIGGAILKTVSEKNLRGLGIYFGWILVSTFAFLVALSITVTLVLHNKGGAAEPHLLDYLEFAAGGLVGSFILAIFLERIVKIKKSHLLLLCIIGLIIGSLGLFLDTWLNRFTDNSLLANLLHNKGMPTFPALFIVWQTFVAGMIGISLRNRTQQ